MTTTEPSFLGVVPGKEILPSTFTEDELREAEDLLVSVAGSISPAIDLSRWSISREVSVRSVVPAFLSFKRMAASLLDSVSFLGIETGESVDREIAARFLSNYMVDASGDRASGNVRVRVSSDTTRTIMEGSRFVSSSGASFLVPATTVYELGNGISRGSGDWWQISVPVVAEEAGVAGNLPSGEPLFPSFQISGLIGSVSSGIDGGRDGFDFASIRTRMVSLLSSRGFSSPAASEAAIMDRFGSSISRVLMAGPSERCVTRARNSITGIPSGGVADIHVRTSGGFRVETATISATKKGDGIFTANIGRDVCRGFWRVSSVSVPSSPGSSVGIVSMTPGFDTASIDPITLETRILGSVKTAVDCGFSVYRTEILELSVDPKDPLYGEDSIEIEVGFLVDPGVATVHDWISSPGNRPNCDVIVKAFTPARISISGIKVSPVDSGTGVDGMALAVASMINSIEPGAPLGMSDVVGAIMDSGLARSISGGFSMSAAIQPPGESAETVFVRSRESIEIPHGTGFDRTNTAFFCSPSDIRVSLV